MFIDEVHEWFRCPQHDSYSNNDCNHHDRKLFHHAYCRDHAVKREYRIKHNNLDNNHPESRMYRIFFFMCMITFNPFMQFHSPLKEQEYPTEQQNQVTAGKRMIKNMEERIS